ncbi:MAG: hypothetical protein IKU98_07590, partial [Bacteroidaceae bacterium]|nr:hypothetical protein [Bacteroidaceae bacterium]
IGLVSCSNDGDGDGNYADELLPGITELKLGKFIINDNSSGYESIELLNSGSYIITLADAEDDDVDLVPTDSTNTTQPDSSQGTSGSISFGTSVGGNSTRGGDDVVSKYLYGSYTMVSQYVYDLDGFGLLTIGLDGDEVNSFDIILDNGKELTVGVTRKKEYANTSATDKLCNEWEMTVMEEKYYDREELVYHIKYTMGKSTLDILVDPYNNYTEQANTFIERQNAGGPKGIIFSKAGTYAVLTNSGYLSSAKWWWKDEANGQMYYSWDEEEEGEEAAYVTTQFSDDKLFVSEIYYPDYSNSDFRKETYFTLEIKEE